VSTHKCPAPPCNRQVRFEQLACRNHWYAIPADLRSRVWDAYLGRSTEDHSEVVAEAISYLHERFPLRSES
jgi:hypothetical protein